MSEVVDSNRDAQPNRPRLMFNKVAGALSVTDADLTGSTFSDVNMSELSVANARLAGAAFTDVDFSNAQFNDVNLSKLSVVNALLPGATFADVDLSNAQFNDVNLSDVAITDSQIEGLTIDGVLVSELLSVAESAGSSKAVFRSVFAIGDSDPAALPVKEIGPAVAYYANVLGFTPVSSEDGMAILRRDDVRIGLAVNGRDPEQASVYFAVSDVDALREELVGRFVGPSEIRIDKYDGGRYRVFFAKEPYGVCFCFGQKYE